MSPKSILAFFLGGKNKVVAFFPVLVFLAAGCARQTENPEALKAISDRQIEGSDRISRLEEKQLEIAESLAALHSPSSVAEQGRYATWEDVARLRNSLKVLLARLDDLGEDLREATDSAERFDFQTGQVATRLENLDGRIKLLENETFSASRSLETLSSRPDGIEEGEPSVAKSGLQSPNGDETSTDGDSAISFDDALADDSVKASGTGGKSALSSPATSLPAPSRSSVSTGEPSPPSPTFFDAESPDSAYRNAFRLFQEEKFEEAAKGFLDYLQTPPPRKYKRESFMYSGIAHFELGNYYDADYYLKETLALISESDEEANEKALWYLGRVREALDDKTVAVAVYRQVVQIGGAFSDLAKARMEALETKNP